MPFGEVAILLLLWVTFTFLTSEDVPLSHNRGSMAVFQTKLKTSTLVFLSVVHIMKATTPSSGKKHLPTGLEDSSYLKGTLSPQWKVT